MGNNHREAVVAFSEYRSLPPLAEPDS